MDSSGCLEISWRFCFIGYAAQWFLGETTVAQFIIKATIWCPDHHGWRVPAGGGPWGRNIASWFWFPGPQEHLEQCGGQEKLAFPYWALTTALPNVHILQIVALEVPEFQSEVILAGNWVLCLWRASSYLNMFHKLGLLLRSLGSTRSSLGQSVSGGFAKRGSLLCFVVYVVKATWVSCLWHLQLGQRPGWCSLPRSQLTCLTLFITLSPSSWRLHPIGRQLLCATPAGNSLGRLSLAGGDGLLYQNSASCWL